MVVSMFLFGDDIMSDTLEIMFIVFLGSATVTSVLMACCAAKYLVS